MLLPVSVPIENHLSSLIFFSISDNVWPASATRSEDLQSLVDNFDYNKDLIHQIRLKNFQVNITGKEDLDLIDPRCFQK